ncbi:MAG: dephospho-CoA kinase [Acidobacteria bacterium]|nr:dephospho-CoA kinase [Acidobacteriota bacterium]
MLLVGLTGGIGSGKSTVARLLAARGAVVIDADEIARRVVAPGEPAWSKLVERFGREILRADSTVDRPKLASVVFGDPAKLAALNEITHPPVIAEIAARLETLRASAEIVVLDVPLLVEVGGASTADLVVVVTASEETRIERLAADRGMSAEEIRARMRAQASAEERAAAADWLIANDGTQEQLASQVDRLWLALEARRARDR